jgi:hypothetical protein
MFFSKVKWLRCVITRTRVFAVLSGLRKKRDSLKPSVGKYEVKLERGISAGAHVEGQLWKVKQLESQIAI